MSILPPDVPNGELNIAIFGVVEAARAFEAHSALSRVRNSQRHKDMDVVTKKQRESFLDVSARLLHSEALMLMDEACVKYLRARGKG